LSSPRSIILPAVIVADGTVVTARIVKQRKREGSANPGKSDGLYCRRVPNFEWWPRAESNHRHADFQSDEGDFSGLLINHLQRLPAPSPGTPRHNYGTPSLSSTQSWHIVANGLIATTLPAFTGRVIYVRENGIGCWQHRQTSV
jgi:hypothetical protein